MFFIVPISKSLFRFKIQRFSFRLFFSSLFVVIFLLDCSISDIIFSVLFFEKNFLIAFAFSIFFKYCFFY